MPVNALSAGESNTVGAEHTLTEQQTLDELNTENIASTEESNATSTEVATDSNAKEDTSISDISSNDIDSSEEKLNNEIPLQNDETEDGEEPSTDNWELGLVFYDSSVDNGKTPLTEINWDASDGGHGQGTPRIITTQINYKNSNAKTTYNPGELKISIPNLIYKCTTAIDDNNSGRVRIGAGTANWKGTILVSANDATHSNYEWNLEPYQTGSTTYTSPNSYFENFVFTNKNMIEEKSNFEGSIQISYTITPMWETQQYEHNQDNVYIEKYEDSCVHEYKTQQKATLNYLDTNIESNEIKLDYTRTYIHKWRKDTFKITKTASKITSYDGLPKNADDYIWVKYKLEYNNGYSYFPNIRLYSKNGHNIEIKDELPEGCVVYDATGQKVEPEFDNTYIFKETKTNGNRWEKYVYSFNIYVGYPKSIYNDENDNLTITNTAEYWGIYANEEEFEKVSESSVTINLAEYRFTYPPGLYDIDKTILSPRELRYQDIINNKTYNKQKWYLSPIAYYSGSPMTVKVGDDFIYATDNNGNYTKLNDDEYYFLGVMLSSMKNGNNETIPKGKYECELWVRYAGEENYSLYKSFKNGDRGNVSTGYSVVFGEWITDRITCYKFNSNEKIVGVYLVIKDMNESLTGLTMNTYTNLYKKDIPQNGEYHNFSYIQAYNKNESGELILQNQPGLESYSSYITQEIAKEDQKAYGTYMQRSSEKDKWSYYNKPMETRISATKSASSIIQDAEKEQFSGSFTIGTSIEKSVYDEIYQDIYNNPEDALYGFTIYDLLPRGMELKSTKQEIIDSISVGAIDRILDTNFVPKNVSNASIKQLIKDNSTINIYHNWKDTGRTKIEIIVDLHETPFFNISTSTYSSSAKITYKFNYSISYDSYLEYGKIWNNKSYLDFTEQPKGEYKKITYTIKDSGYYDKEAIDINENNDTDELIGYANAQVTLNSIIATHQDVTKYVQTDKSNYSTGTVKASPSSEYNYKLRVRTGSADVTNLVIYDSIEEYVQDPYSAEQSFITAYGTKKHWNGEFLGVDTSYAEKKGYKVKVYYSEDMQAGNLSDDDSWKEYSDSVDKSKVKSLAFEYLDKDDESQKAVLPANSQTYVLVKMKAPPEENRKILAYNGCRTQWQALDDYDRPVDFITGINSNIVKVSLSDYYDLTVNKTWEDENNKWGLRPESIDIILKKDGKEVERKQITKDNLSVTFTDLLIEDSDRYTIEEEPSVIYEPNVVYNEIDDCYEITNTLKNDIFTDISGTKTWVGDTESKRPESITINLLKDGKVYRTTTTNAEKDWKYIFPKVPIYNADETRCIYSVEEIPIEKYTTQYTNGNGTDNRNGLAIKFNSQCRTERANYDYVEIYYKQDGQTFKLGKWGGTALAGKTVNVPTKDFYLYWRTDGSQCSYYGFSIDSIESAEVSATGTVATLPNYTATELTGTDYPESPNHGNYGNNVKMLWHYTGNFTSDVPAEGLFNLVNTYEGVDSVNISFIKGIEGTDEAFEKLQLEKDALYSFQVSMKNRETNDIIHVLIDNKNVTTINEVPIGTYVITEKDDMYFDFVSMEAFNSAEGITFEKVGDDYVLSITEDAAEEETLQIKVNNKIEPDRPYEDKEEKENLFRIHKKERPETSETTNTSETSSTSGSAYTSSSSSWSTTGSYTSGTGSGSYTTGSGTYDTGRGTYISGTWTVVYDRQGEIFSPEVPHN